MRKAELKEKILAKSNLPRHVAIIMDGNGRWACKRGLPRIAGHRAGVEAVRRVVRAAGEIKIPFLTLYTFSIENWRRPRSEVTALMNLLYQTTRNELKELMDNKVRLVATGRIDALSPLRRAALLNAIEKTKNNSGITLNLALNYGGRTEILDAVRSLANEVAKGKIKPHDIDEKLFADHLYTKGLPDPDLLIRTSGEMRISNFLLWQTSYTELYVTDILWPDFDAEDFYNAIWNFQNRQRRFGRV